MKILKCCLCDGELEIIGDKYEINKKIKCRDCGFSNDTKQKEPEVFIRRSFVNP